jgi:predicted TPR repeat methyltransferase
MAVYDDWAEEYDDIVLSHGYITPKRCVDALQSLEQDRNVSILDIGCGTGISGLALKEAGFTCVTGSEVNAAMLEKAKARKGVYTDLMLVDKDNPFDFPRGHYRHITAMGVIATGHAPASMIEDVLEKLAPGGMLVFSLNDHTLGFQEYPDTVDRVIADGRAECLYDEYGDHLPKLEIKARVIVLSRR